MSRLSSFRQSVSLWCPADSARMRTSPCPFSTIRHRHPAASPMSTILNSKVEDLSRIRADGKHEFLAVSDPAFDFRFEWVPVRSWRQKELRMYIGGGVLALIIIILLLIWLL